MNLKFFPAWRQMVGVGALGLALVGPVLGGGISSNSGCGGKECKPEHGARRDPVDLGWRPTEPGTYFDGPPPYGVGFKWWTDWERHPGEVITVPSVVKVLDIEINPADPTQWRAEYRLYPYDLPKYLTDPYSNQTETGKRCNDVEVSQSNAQNHYSAGNANVSAPQIGQNVQGCYACGSASPDDAPLFTVEISLGTGVGGLPQLDHSPVASIVFNGNLGRANMLTLADFSLEGGTGAVSGSLSIGPVIVTDPDTNDVVSTTTINTTSSGGLLQTVTFVVTPASGPATTHVFSREGVAAYEGVRYTRTEGTESQSLDFYNLGVDMPPNGEHLVTGGFRVVNMDGSVETWFAPEEVPLGETGATFTWTTDSGHVNGGYFDGELVETHEFTPASAGQPTVVTINTYGRIGFEHDGNKRVLLSTEVSHKLGESTLSTEITHYGYDERPYLNFSTATPYGTSNPRFGERLWTVAPDKSWSLEVAAEELALVWYEIGDPFSEEGTEWVDVLEIVFGDVRTFTPWLDGPALVNGLATRGDMNTFFADLAGQAQNNYDPDPYDPLLGPPPPPDYTSNRLYIPGCRSTWVQHEDYKSWSERRLVSIGDLKHGVEYDYKEAFSDFVVTPELGFNLGDRQERWNAAETAGSWSAQGGTYRESASLDQAGVATISTTSELVGGGSVTDTWRVAVAATGGYGSPNRSLPAYEPVGDHPLWSSTEYDDKGRVVAEISKVRLSGVDSDIGMVATSHSGDTAYERTSGGALLAAQGEDVVASGQRTSTRTDGQGVTTTTVIDEATGELISETKEGVAASGSLAAQPDLTTSYARGTNVTTGLTTRTVTQTDGTTTRTLSVTVTDALGRTQSTTDETGRVTSYVYDGLTTTETLPGGLTRITETYLDGQTRRVYGTGVTPQYYTYAVNDGTVAGYEAGSITQTVYLNDDGTGGTRSTHWRRTTTNYLGQVLREEQPSPATGGGVTVTEHFYNAKGQRVKTTRSGTADMLMAYDAFGRVVGQGYDVDGNGELEVESNDVLTETLVDYEQVGGAWVEKTTHRLHTQADGDNALDTVTRRTLAEGAASWQSTTAPDGSVTRYESSSDAEDHLRVDTVSRAAPGAGTLTAVQTSTSYNGLQVAQSLPGASAALTFGYNGFGQMTSQVHPVAGTSTWTYDSATGQQLTQTAAGSSTVTYTYYASSHANAGQVASMTANGEVTRYAYDTQGRQTHQWGTGSQPLKYVYDGLGRLHELHTYQGGSGWDSSTLPAAFGSATPAVTTWDYHPGTSALWKKTDAASEFVEYAYDSGHSGLLAVKTNARGITTTYAHAVASGGKKLPGMVTGLDYSDSTPDVDMTYLRGQLTTVTDAAGLSTFTSSGATRTTTVTGGGLLTDLVLTRTEFGADMPETVQAQVGGSTVALNQHQWNADGTLAKAWQGDRSTGSGGSGIRHVWGRNATTGRLEGIGTEAFGSGATHGIARGYTHTAGGRVEKVWYNAGTLGTPSTSVQGFDYAHDTHGRREAVAPYLPDNAPAAADQPPGWKYGYNERGEVEVADRFTAAGGPSTGVVTHQRRSYDYDLMGNRNTATQGTNVGELKETGYSANILQQYDGITHTRQVEITGQAVAGATVELTLDGGTPVTVNRSLPEHQTGDPDSFRYVHTVGGTDARWLHVSIKASLGGIDITRAGFSHVPPSSEALAYDEDGNLTETAEWDYTWDAENRLTVAEQKSLPVAGGFTAPVRKKLEFDYDYKNRRISKRVYQSSGGGWSLTKDLRFVYDGWQMIAELDHTFATGTGLGGSAVNRTFLWGPDLSGSMTGAGGVGGLLSTTYQGITYQACSDANGNVTGLVPVSGTGAGTLVARFDYDPFGNRVTNAGPNVELCPFGFSSKYLDTESRIVSYELRGYLPGLGRWMSRDPIEEQGGLNLYGIVGNDAVNQWDYLGQTGVGEILNQFFRVFGGAEKLWVMNENDQYTKRVRQWDPVIQQMQTVRRLVASSNATWNRNHRTTSSWRPSMSFSPDPRAGYNKMVANPPGTDPDTARRHFLIYLATNIETDALHWSSIGSFTIIATVDEIRGCQATINVWMYNEMSRKSFGRYANKIPFRWSSMRSQFMWWNWKEKIEFDTAGRVTKTLTQSHDLW